MPTDRTTPATIDEYVARFPPEVQAVLERLRATIRKAAPDATETISYQIPTFTLHGNLVYFAAWTKHVAMYPVPRSSPALLKALAPYVASKGTLRFPLDAPLPLGLIRRAVQARVRENRARAAAKGQRKT